VDVGEVIDGLPWVGVRWFWKLRLLFIARRFVLDRNASCECTSTACTVTTVCAHMDQLDARKDGCDFELALRLCWLFPCLPPDAKPPLL